MSTYYDMMQVVLSISKKHNIQVNSISRIGIGKEFIISLTYKEDAHDGSKCKKLTIDDGWKPVHNLTCVTDPAITRIELDGAKSEIPDADNEVTVKTKEIEVGMELYYYGNDKTKHGKKCRVMSVSNNGYSNTIQFEDDCTYNQISCTQLRRKVNGA